MLPAALPGPPRTEQELRIFYHRACVTCHGEDGSAVSTSGKNLKGRDFTAERAMSKSTDLALVKAIQNGIYFGLDMPSYKRDLTHEETLLLVQNILRKARRGESILAQSQVSVEKRAQAIPPSGTR